MMVVFEKESIMLLFLIVSSEAQRLYAVATASAESRNKSRDKIS